MGEQRAGAAGAQVVTGSDGGKACSADESLHLPVHVARCEERYRSLFHRLERIERAIEQANTVGLRKRYPYRHLLPSTIPQSINI